jgi:hypothetical protein
MAQYICTVQATTNTSINTEDTFMDLEAPASFAFKVKRIRVSHNTAASDSNTRIKIFRKTAIGAGSVGGTEVKKNPLSATPQVVATVKNGTSTYAVGTTTDLIDEVQVNGRGIWEWVARDDDDMIIPTAGDFIGVNILNNTASIIVKVTMEWIE